MMFWFLHPILIIRFGPGKQLLDKICYRYIFWVPFKGLCCCLSAKTEKFKKRNNKKKISFFSHRSKPDPSQLKNMRYLFIKNYWKHFLDKMCYIYSDSFYRGIVLLFFGKKKKIKFKKRNNQKLLNSSFSAGPGPDPLHLKNMRYAFTEYKCDIFFCI